MLKIDFARISDALPTVLKIYVPAFGRIIVTVQNADDTTSVIDYDYSANKKHQINRAAGSYPLYHMAQSLTEDIMEVAIVSGNEAATEITELEVAAYPAYPYLATGQTETADTATESEVVAADTVADHRTDWFARLGDAYKRGLSEVEEWWKRTSTGGSAKNLRSADVMDVEIPHWWKGVIAVCSGAVAGRAWTTMTVAEIEACVTHIETLLDAGIIEIWYGVGIAIDSANLTTSVPNTSPLRNGSVYASPLTAMNGMASVYTDTFEVSESKLVPRTPDYAWNSIAVSIPATWDAENPS